MEEDTEYKKLPVEERCVHKLWKARLNGFEESIKIFREIDDEKSPEWNRFTFLIKKFVVDAHAQAQERGLEATLIFVENSASAGKVVSDVMSGIVQKCIAAQKTKTRELATQVTLMYVEVEKHEAVVEELIKGMDHKNPKIVAACTSAVTEALREFGHKVVGVKALVKQIGRLLTDRDLGVRKEGKTMTVEIYRWIGDALKPQLTSLSPVVITELEAEFAKLGKEKAEPTRYLKSQQAKATQQLSAAANDDGEADNGDEDENEAEAMDPMDLIDPVDILSKLPKDFYDKLEEKKWQTRKEALEALETLLQNPKLLPGDYGDVVKALKKVLTKDSNVVLVAMAGKCLASLARGLGKKFSPYAQVCVSGILEKFKEKKANVVAALRDAIDSIYPSTSIENMQEDLFEALANKNPSVKSETTLFLARAFTKTLPVTFNKKLLKALTVALIKTLNESDPLVRDGSAEALGTLQKLLGEKMLSVYLVDVDPLKLAKIKEFSDKAVIVVKVPTVKKAKPAPAKAEPPPVAAAPPKQLAKRPASSSTAVKKVVPKKPSSASASTTKAPAPSALPTERELTPEEIVEKAAEILPANCISELSDSNWKTRLAASETLLNAIATMEPRPELSQLLCKVLCQKPGLKDTNFQVVKVKLEAIQRVIETLNITTVTAGFMVNDVTEKLSDAKNSALAGSVLLAMADSLNLQHIVSRVLEFAFEQKSPKVQSESLLWTGKAITEFGMQVNPKTLIDDLKKGISSTNVTVRQSTFAVLGILYLYTGETLMMFFDSEKPAIKQQIQAEFDKQDGKKAPAPVRGPVAKRSSSNDDGQMANGDDQDDDDAAPAINLKDLIPRVDISSQITEALLVEICDKDWKTRNEGLTKLQGILNDAKMITPNIGDLPHTLGQRLVDSNAKIAQTALAICQQLAQAIGPPCKQYVRAFFPGFLNGLGDGKQFIRTASITCMNVWGDQCGYKEFFEGEMLADAMKTGSPALRSELWCWLAEKMPNIAVKQIAKDELVPCLPYLYLNICDRNADVRKHANDAVYGFMLHLGYDAMLKAVEKVKQSSKKDVVAALDKTKPNMPVKPLPKSKQQAPILDDPKSARADKAGTKIQKAPSGAKINAPVARKKEEDIDTSPVLAVNNLKNQRMLDEQKLKVLKWNFTTPREEFIELLRDQMSAANVNKALMANMFHDDFRYHLKALETLHDDLNDNSKALICNLDLVLKWISLRFYDTNPSVLLKALDYLSAIFDILIGDQYNLADAEGSCFIPHFLIKIGDPKDSVRNSVRSIIINQICLIYPCGKVFGYLMEALKSKNARQRTESLDTLSAIIEKNGMSVCQPTPSAAFKEIAKNISDRDNSVRSAALNCVVQGYFLAGEKVYKMIGNLSEKDMSMLDERIKRATKTKKKSPEPAAPSTQTLDRGASRNMSGNSGHDSDNECEDERTDMTPEEVVVPQTPPAVERAYEPATVAKHREFGLDQNFMNSIENGWTRISDTPKLELPKLDMEFLHSPLKAAEVNGVCYPKERLNELMLGHHTSPRPQPPPVLTSSVAASGYTSTLPTELQPRLDPRLMRTILAIASEDSILARAALNEMNDILETPDKHAALRDHEDIYIESICKQFQHLNHLPMSESLQLFQPILSSVYTFLTASSLGKKLSIPSLKMLMHVLLGLMADNKLTNSEESQYSKVINGICMRVFERTNFTNLNCALIRLLKETCSTTGAPKFTDLLMKCIWRSIKLMPERQHELDFDAILTEIHKFLECLPSTWWQTRPTDTPLRTIKTIIHNLAKLKGKEILQYLGNFPATSELHTYLLRVLKNIKIPTDSEKQNKKLVTETMINIFKLIPIKERRREGFAQLYELQKQYPELDMRPYTSTNPVFVKYVDEGLAEAERNYNSHGPYRPNNMASHVTVTQSSTSVVPGVLGDSGQALKNPEYWLERLDKLKNMKIAASSGTENSSAYKKTVVDQPATTEVTAKITHPNKPVSSNRLELLQKKLSHIRNQNP